MTNIIMAFSHFDTGGLQTLMLRIAKWCCKNNIKCFVLYETCDDLMKTKLDDIGIKYCSSFNYKKITHFLENNIDFSDKNFLITFELPEYMYFQKIIDSYFKNYMINHLIYSVSVESLIYGKNIKGIVGNIIKDFYKNIVSKLYDNNQIIFMDDETHKSAINFFDLNKKTNVVYHLPMFIKEIRNVEYKSNNKIILTVSRSVFPYKGYLVGLVKDFRKLCESYSDIILEIVTFGSDFPVLKDEIDKLEYKVKERIIIHEKLDESEIDKLMEKAYLYVGMGTTVLDAANLCLPSVVVWHSTMDNIASDLFSQDPFTVGKKEPGFPAIKYIQNYLSMSEIEYESECNRVYHNLKENYGIDNFMYRLLDINIKKKHILSFYDFLGHKVLFSIRNFRRKVKRLE